MVAAPVEPSPKLHSRFVTTPVEASAKVTVSGTVPLSGAPVKPADTPAPAVTRKASDVLNVTSPFGVENTIAASFRPSGSAPGILNWAETEYWLAWATALPVTVPIYLVSILAGGVHTARRGWAAIRALALDINALMLLAVIGAAAIGQWSEAAAVIFLFALAQWLETRSMDRVRHAIRALMDLTPSEALVRRDGREARVPVDDLAIGETIISQANLEKVVHAIHAELKQ